MTNDTGGTSASTNAKNFAITILVLVLSIGLWKVLDATSDYIIDARATSTSINQVIYEYRNAVGDVGGKMAELLDAQIQIAGAVEESVRASRNLIDESKERIAWAADMMENLFPATAQSDIGGMLSSAVGTLSNALEYLMENPDDVRGAIQSLISGIIDAKPLQLMGQGMEMAVGGMTQAVGVAAEGIADIAEDLNPCGG